MHFEHVRNILHTNDGSLPDIHVDFGHARVVAEAYALIQARAARLTSLHAYYWSKGTGTEVPIRFGDNPARALLAGDAEGFHVVFGGLRSAAGAPIPDLGVFVLDAAYLALDYRMGPEWDAAAIRGLFEIMRELRALDEDVEFAHTGNLFEGDDGILLDAFENWLAAAPSQGR